MIVDLFTLGYKSTANLTATEVAREVAAIVAVSQARNLQDGVTGALTFVDGTFYQVIEGLRQPLAATFRRIQRDTRHKDLVILAIERLPERRFGNWSMALAGRTGNARDYFEDRLAEPDAFLRPFFSSSVLAHTLVEMIDLDSFVER